MKIDRKESLFRSNRKTLVIVKLMLCVNMIMVLVIGVSFYVSNIDFFLIALLPILFIFLLILFMMVTVKNYEITEFGLCIEKNYVPWSDIVSLRMPFQSRRILLIIYEKRNKRKYVTLIANKIKDKSSFIPKTLQYDFQTEQARFGRLHRSYF